jgi:hypothetical protein
MHIPCIWIKLSISELIRILIEFELGEFAGSLKDILSVAQQKEPSLLYSGPYKEI